MNLANGHISSLETKLRDSIEECEATRAVLYESETARHNELQSRMAFQRHLRLEQHRYSECAQARLSLEEERGRMKAEMEAMLMFNEMLRQEIEHNESIIESMATKISTYENAAESVIASLKERAQLAVEQEAVEPNAKAGTPDTFTFVMVDECPLPKSTADSGIDPGVRGRSVDVLVDQPSPLPMAKRKSQKMLEGSDGAEERRAKMSRKSKAARRADTKLEHHEDQSIDFFSLDCKQ
jgi:hypothetical protein